jgi:hypothetical protein
MHFTGTGFSGLRLILLSPSCAQKI